MKTRSSLARALAALACIVCNSDSHAATMQTVGSGSAVSSVDLSAAFDALNASTVVHLETFTEGGLKVSTSADSWAADLAMAARLDPFDGAMARTEPSMRSAPATMTG
jgi:hypothetical protein